MNAKAQAMIKPKEAESARMGTAGTCSPGKTCAAFFTSVVNVCVLERDTWQKRSLALLPARGTFSQELQVEKDKNYRLPAQNIFLLVDLLTSVIMDMLVFSFFLLIPIPSSPMLSCKCFSSATSHIKLTAAGKTRGKERSACESKALLHALHLTNIELAVQFQSCVSFCWCFPDLQG